MGYGDVDLFRARFLELGGGAGDGAAGGDHVVEHDGDFAFDRLSDEVLLAGLVGIVTALVDNRQAGAESFGVANGSLDAADIGTDDDAVVGLVTERLDELIEDWGGVEVVDRDVKEALNLWRMEVHRQHAVSAGPRDEVGDELGGDWDAAFVLAVLAGVAEVGNDFGDARGAGPLAAVDHDQQLDEVVVDRRAGRLHEEDVAAADVFFDFAEVFAIGEFSERDLAQRQVQEVANRLCEGAIGLAAEDF